MKKISLLFILMVCFIVVGCKDKQITNKDITNNEVIKKESIVNEEVEENLLEKYVGDWKLKKEPLYMVTALDDYFGVTGINIKSVEKDKVKLSVYAISSKPSYRKAEVNIEGIVKDNEIVSEYEDSSWGDKGIIKIQFLEDEIKAEIVKDRKDKDVELLWELPSGEYSFVKPIEADIVDLAEIHMDKIKDSINSKLQKDNSIKLMFKDFNEDNKYYLLVETDDFKQKFIEVMFNNDKVEVVKVNDVNKKIDVNTILKDVKEKTIENDIK